MKPVLEVHQLWKQYKIGQQKASYLSLREQLTQLLKSRKNKQEKFWALREVDFEVQEGECLGIIGRNGAGKSTLLKIFSKITPPTKGHILLRGRVVSLLEVGTGFHPELTGRENVYLNGSILGMARLEINSRFDEIVEFSGVSQFLDTPLKHYSSGMKLRLAFSVAAHLQPEILLIDEVLAVGDAEFQKKCLGKMDEVSKSGRTVIFVSHDLRAIRTLCQKGLVLNKGRMNFLGNVNEAVATYEQFNKQETSFLASQYSFEGEISGMAGLRFCSIVNSEGVNSSKLKYNEPFSIKMVWEKREKTPALAIAIRVFNSIDQLVFAVNTLHEQNLSLEEKGTCEITCHLPTNVLVPGIYNFEIGAHIRPHTTIQVIKNCIAVTVTDEPFDTSNPFTIVGNPSVGVKSIWQSKTQ